MPSNTTESEEVGVVSDDQFAAHDHLFPSPATPPQVPSDPPPSHVRTAAKDNFGIKNMQKNKIKTTMGTIFL